MSDYFNMETIKSYWINLSERDRLVLSIGSIVLVVYLFYLLIYAPLTDAVETQSKVWIEKQETLAWMKRQSKVKPQSKQADRNLLSLFSTQLKQTSFSQFPYQLQQSGPDHVQLSFDNIPYVDFLTWLRKLNQRYTMSISELTAIPTQTSGVVKMNVVVEKKETGE
jgi:general secretion pathway protein M